MCDCHNDEVAVGEHIKLVIVVWWVAQCFRRHEPRCALDGGATCE